MAFPMCVDCRLRGQAEEDREHWALARVAADIAALGKATTAARSAAERARREAEKQRLLGQQQSHKDARDKAFSRGWLLGPEAAPTEAMTVRANAESAIRRRATVTAPREPAVDWLELADRRAEAAAAATCV